MIALIIIITFIVSIMTFSSKRIQFIVRFFFSSITSYWLLNIQYNGTIRLLNDNEYTQKNIQEMINSGIALKSILYALLVYFVFYGIIRFVLQKIFDKPFYNKFKKIDIQSIRQFQSYVL